MARASTSFKENKTPTPNKEKTMNKPQPNHRQFQLEMRDQVRTELARENPYYTYIEDKKNPDPALPYEIWNKRIIDENRI